LTRAGERESRETGDKGIKPKLVSKKNERSEYPIPS
jgi:hypothetical protein